jgi:predicted nucleic acid-binding protein
MSDLAEVLLDTDVLVDHLRGARRIEPGQDQFVYSVVTRAELLAGRATDEARVRLLLAPMREIVVDRTIAERAGTIRRDKPVLLPDALIAATALELGIPLVTRNRRDFEAIPGLTLQFPGGSAGDLVIEDRAT